MRYSLVVVALLLTCVPAHAQQDPVVTCIKALAPSKPANPPFKSEDDKFPAISSKISIAVVTDTTLTMLADESLATPEEQHALSEWIDARAACVRSGDNWRQQNYPPQIYALALEGESRVRMLAADLYGRRISFGEFNKRRLALADDIRARLASVLQQLQAQAAQRSPQAQTPTWMEAIGSGFQGMGDVARAGAASRSTVEPPSGTPLYTPPVQTNCQWIGNIWTCNSH